jgi:hypothetical protein
MSGQTPARCDSHQVRRRDDHQAATLLTSACLQKVRIKDRPVTVDVPRDRQGEFAPAIVPKGRRRLPQIDEMVLSLYARGMTTRAIAAHLKEVYGAEASPALISRITDVVADEITAWMKPARRRGLPDPLHRRAQREGPRRRHGHQQVRPPGHRPRRRRDQERTRDLARKGHMP